MPDETRPNHEIGVLFAVGARRQGVGPERQILATTDGTKSARCFVRPSRGHTVTHTASHLPLCFAIALTIGVAAPSLAQANPSSETRGASNGTRRISPTRVRARAARLFRQGETASQDVSALLDEARRNRDRRFAACLDRRLAELNATLRMFEDRYTHLNRALDARDAPRSRYLVGVLEVLGRRMEELELSALTCPGNHRMTDGETMVEVIRPDR